MHFFFIMPTTGRVLGVSDLQTFFFVFFHIFYTCIERKQTSKLSTSYNTSQNSHAECLRNETSRNTNVSTPEHAGGLLGIRFQGLRWIWWKIDLMSMECDENNAEQNGIISYHVASNISTVSLSTGLSHVVCGTVAAHFRLKFPRKFTNTHKFRVQVDNKQVQSVVIFW